MKERKRLDSSFRDPSGYVFEHHGTIYRQVNEVYRVDYDKLMSSGLYDKLVDKDLLIPHTEVTEIPALDENAYRILRPQQVPFISYPYEWCFTQLKDAALTILEIQLQAMSFDMSLKDASAYNIQFIEGKPRLIDTLSFETYAEGHPWVPYHQFCRHFLAPLALMAYCDVRLSRLLQSYIDGIPLDLAAKLLPFGARFKPGLLLHLFAHASSQQRFSSTSLKEERMSTAVSRNSLRGLIESLQRVIGNLNWQASGIWMDYYDGDSYQEIGFRYKQEVVEEFIQHVQPTNVWDLGANTGVFSRIAARLGANTVAWDIDPGAVENNYATVRENHETNLLPLVIDLTAPSPAIGWANLERSAFMDRSNADLVLALALIHHLAISNNVPLLDIAATFATLSEWLIIEFVPKSDPKVKELLATRKDIFPDFTHTGFEAAFNQYYTIQERRDVEESERSLYLMKRRSN